MEQPLSLSFTSIVGAGIEVMHVKRNLQPAPVGPTCLFWQVLLYQLTLSVDHPMALIDFNLFQVWRLLHVELGTFLGPGVSDLTSQGGSSNDRSCVSRGGVFSLVNSKVILVGPFMLVVLSYIHIGEKVFGNLLGFQDTIPDLVSCQSDLGDSWSTPTFTTKTKRNCDHSFKFEKQKKFQNLKEVAGASFSRWEIR